MNTIILEKIQSQKIGRMPVVILPLKTWQGIEEQLEELEMLNSQSFRKKITKARSEKKIYSSLQVKKILGI